jgi:glycosyltransferase involved in cell wall biosynthesis
MRPLHIRFFVSFVHEQGTYLRFHNLARALRELGQRVEVYGMDHVITSVRRHESRDGVPYHIFPSVKGSHTLRLLHPLNILRMFRWADSGACDVAHLFQPFPVAGWSWRCCQAGAKFYDWDDLWVGGLMSPPSSLRTWLELSVIRHGEERYPAQADHVTACGDFLAGLARARAAKAVTVLHNGLWPSRPVAQAAARRALGLAAEARYVGFMGRTCDELGWILAALKAESARFPSLRLALCGPPDGCLDGLDAETRSRVDYLGQLTPAQTRDFAAALDLGLLPLADNAFNRSRFPIKFAEYMAAGAPVLCSAVGECGVLSPGFPWVLNAGKTREDWDLAFAAAMPALMAGSLPRVDRQIVDTNFAWPSIAEKLLQAYRGSLPRHLVEQSFA